MRAPLLQHAFLLKSFISEGFYLFELSLKVSLSFFLILYIAFETDLLSADTARDISDTDMPEAYIHQIFFS